ncbi:protein of unknown function [Lutibacter oricola]|uniref:DUF4249 domain-containing protein n=1 Tax=Lutibacter oricola TaxID=762486 RepID=A0A1H2WVK1_9FLAO|nr:DUF4249 domain-containing protein [Lutibacter oricola]SDW84577.1 protein of unknown function [Lutibacter oricola]
MKNTYIKLAITCLVLLVVSCTETVDVDVPDGGERLVVEASILWEKGTTGQNQEIILSKSTEYFANELDVPVTGAVVSIINNDTNETFEFQGSGNGTYNSTNFNPVIGNSYTLTINYNGEHYEATEIFTAGVEISSVEQTLESRINEDVIVLKVYYDDPEATKDYYMGEFIPSHKPLIALESSDDKFYNGNNFFIRYDEEDLASGVTVQVKLHGISEDFYNYIEVLTSQLGEDGPFQTTPSRLKGNCTNINNLEEEVLGYFRLNEVDVENILIE